MVWWRENNVIFYIFFQVYLVFYLIFFLWKIFSSLRCFLRCNALIYRQTCFNMRFSYIYFVYHPYTVLHVIVSGREKKIREMKWNCVQFFLYSSFVWLAGKKKSLVCNVWSCVYNTQQYSFFEESINIRPINISIFLSSITTEDEEEEERTMPDYFSSEKNWCFFKYRKSTWI